MSPVFRHHSVVTSPGPFQISLKLSDSTGRLATLCTLSKPYCD
ncbi:unnamed protein product, partial [Brugia timori]|uniref:Uncharacterized protein n=1 Tax=Brugia timori TaxID=42155 RepID=A0A0R3QAF8_9BILA